MIKIEVKITRCPKYDEAFYEGEVYYGGEMVMRTAPHAKSRLEELYKFTTSSAVQYIYRHDLNEDGFDIHVDQIPR